MKSARLVLLAAALAACGGSRPAVGTVSSVIVVATDSLWSLIGDSIEVALEPRIFTVRDERTFEVTHIAPTDPRWSDLRQFRQVLAIGAAGDPWVEPVLRRADARAAAAPSVVRARDVWARNQFATALVLPASNAADAALPELARAAAVIDSVFRVYAVQRMYTTRPDTALRDTLRQTHGFGLLLPGVYTGVTRAEHIALFQNSTRIGGDLVRSVLIASRAGVLPPTADRALAWRDSLARTEYRPPQRTLRDRIDAAPVTVDGGQGVEVQGIWEGTDPTWPTGGPFIARMVPCPGQNRTFLLDTWLFAPGPRRSKYEYMIQLETILNTFECA